MLWNQNPKIWAKMGGYLLIGQIVSPLYRPFEVGTLEVAKRALYRPYQEK